MKTGKVCGIIHLFALLHPTVALVCRSIGITDEIWLTLLSITMIVLIGIRKEARVEMTVATVIVANAAGWLLGVYGAKAVGFLSSSDLLTHAVSTFLTTEILGWCTTGFFDITGKISGSAARQPVPRRSAGLLDRYIPGLIVPIMIIIIFRICLTLLFRSEDNSDYVLFRSAEQLLTKSWILVIMMSIIILTVRWLRLKGPAMPSAAKPAVIACSAAAVSAASAVIAGWQAGSPEHLTFLRFMQLFTVALAIYLIFYSVIYMADYAITAQAAIQSEKDKANQAKYRYAILKQQVNPHFLFNSLNILDCMVQDGENAQASVFIHKLSGIYRYMLHSGERTVCLKDELEFMQMYVDLLKVRFQDGFEVSTDIRDEALKACVVPCSLQILVENAIKHNRVGGDGILEIRIFSDGRSLCVTNNLRPKISAGESTKVGLEYLRRQYADLCGSEIDVSGDNGEFKVTIPLIQHTGK